MGIAGACRGMELVELTTDDVQDLSKSLLVNVKNTKNYKDRSFIIKNSPNNEVQFVELCKKYMSLRSPATKHNRFFVAFKNNVCSTQPVGKNTFGKLPQQIAVYLNLPDANLYTGHCFRRTSASLLADSGASIDVLKRHGGWKSSTVAEGYVENSVANKTNIAENIFGHSSQIPIEASNSALSIESTIHPYSAETNNSSSNTEIQGNCITHTTEQTNRLLNLVSCNNVTINVNIQK